MIEDHSLAKHAHLTPTNLFGTQEGALTLVRSSLSLDVLWNLVRYTSFVAGISRLGLGDAERSPRYGHMLAGSHTKSRSASRA